MNWMPVYALLILFSTITTWWCAMKIHGENGRSKRWLVACLFVNFSILFVYKYLNFVNDSVWTVLNFAGLRMQVPHFDLLLPVGISFYTFQAVGYTIDVYRKDIEPERNFFTYALFVSFFPQLVAGPIERAKNLLPQFHKWHVFNSAECIEGLKLMVWGYFMKLCIAENVAPYVNAVFNNLQNHNGTSVWLASFFFTFQIFCDFGGYSLIAIGTARCLGFRLMQNFNHPYLSRSMKEFWRRWHISLSTWFMDYVYIPLGGSRCSEVKHQRNLLITMLVSGIWHGSNWTFIWWGGYHGLMLVASTLWQKYVVKIKRNGFFHIVVDVVLSFFIAMMGWVFFRANTLSDALLAFQKMFTQPGQLYNGEGKPAIALPLVLIGLLMLKEMKDEYGWRLNLMHNHRPWVAYTATALMIVVILLCARFESGQFIYFQF